MQVLSSPKKSKASGTRPSTRSARHGDHNGHGTAQNSHSRMVEPVRDITNPLRPHRAVATPQLLGEATTLGCQKLRGFNPCGVSLGISVVSESIGIIIRVSIKIGFSVALTLFSEHFFNIADQTIGTGQWAGANRSVKIASLFVIVIVACKLLF